MKHEAVAISTQRLTIRSVRMEDDQQILNAASCPQIHLMHSNGFHDLSSVRSYIEVLRKEYANGKYRTLAMAEKPEDRLVGLITLDIDQVFPRAEISYWVDVHDRNMGYATEAVEAMLEYGFTRFGLNRIQAMHFTDNPASGRVLEKAGMAYEGTLHQYVGMGNVFFDCKMYAILKSDFETQIIRKTENGTMDESQAMKAAILKYEMDFFDEGFCQSRNNLENRLSAGFVEYGKSGRVYHRRDTIDALHGSPSRNIRIEDFELTVHYEDLFIAHYLSIDLVDHSKALRTSIWKREEGLLKIFFHQGTLV